MGTDVSKEHAASIIRIELRAEEVVRLCVWVARKVVYGRGRGEEIDLHPAPTDFCMWMEAASCSETLVSTTQKTTI